MQQIKMENQAKMQSS